MSKQVKNTSTTASINTLEIQSKYVDNIEQFIKTLETTHIYFMFFLADKMDEPLVSDVFSKYNDWYIIHGKESNYWYAYFKSEMVFMIYNLRVKTYNDPITIYSVDLNKKGNTW